MNVRTVLISAPKCIHFIGVYIYNDLNNIDFMMGEYRTIVVGAKGPTQNKKKEFPPNTFFHGMTWQGVFKSDNNIDVYFYIPPKRTTTSPVFVAVHGASRRSDTYFSHIMATGLPQRYNVAVNI